MDTDTATDTFPGAIEGSRGQGADAHEYRLIGQLAETPARVTASQEAADIHRYGHVAAWR